MLPRRRISCLQGYLPLATPASKDEVKTQDDAKANESKADEKTATESLIADTLQQQSADTLAMGAMSATVIPGGDLWANSEAEIRAYQEHPTEHSRGLWYIFFAGFIGGLIALVTPCVWPMIPMTVSFFLKSNKSRRKSIISAMVYGLSIIVIYVALGLIVTASSEPLH